MAGSNEKLRVLRRIPDLRFEEELRGYNKSQVDRVLENLAPLADEVDVLLSRLSEAETRAASAEAKLMERPGADVATVAPEVPAVDREEHSRAGFDNETISKTLLLAQQAADNKVREATVESTRLREDAASKAAAVVADATTEADRIRAEVSAQREAMMRAAETDVAALVTSARDALAVKVSAAEAKLVEEHEETRSGLIAQIEQLMSTRDLLTTDVDQFEGHLAARRETIREALVELAAIVEDPDQLRTHMPPSAVDVAPVDPAARDTIRLDRALVHEIDVAVDRPDPDATQAISVVDVEAERPDRERSSSGDAEVSGVILGEDPDATQPDGGGAGVPAAFDPERTTDDVAEAGIIDGLDDALADRGLTDDVVGSDRRETEAFAFADQPSADGQIGAGPSFASDAGRAVDDEAAPPEAEEGDTTQAANDPFGHDGAEAAEETEETEGEMVGVARPAWAEAIPDAEPTTPADTSGDPFLDELRRVTNEPSEEEDEKLSRFLSDEDDAPKGGWFSRRK